MEYRPITTRTELLDYIKRKLGTPARSVKMSDDQYEDAIDDALDVFLKHAYSGTDTAYVLFDIVAGQTVYNLPDDIVSVVDIMKGDNIYEQISRLPRDYTTSYTMSLMEGGYLNYTIINSYLDMMDDCISPDILYDFNEDTKELRIHSNPESKSVLLEVEKYTGVDQTAFNKLYNNTWIKKRAYANAMYTWAVNMMKYRGNLFDGGLELDKEAIMNEAKDLIEKSDEDLMNTYTDSIGIIYK